MNTAHVLISRYCVNNCIFCAVAGKRKAREFPEKRDIINFMKECSGSGISNLIFSGLGEPTLDAHFEGYLKIANELGFQKICLFTNGYALSEEKAAKWKLSGLSAILLSLHGMENGHDRNTQRAGSFREAVRALEIYSQLNFSVSVNTCLTRHNLNEIKELKQYLSGYRIDTHTLSFPEWTGNTKHYTDDLVNYEDIYANLSSAFEPGDEIIVFDNIPYCFVNRDIREMKGLSPVRYLDGKGEIEFIPNARNLYPEICRESKCPFFASCPGFDKDYLVARGWGGIRKTVYTFLANFTSNDTATNSEYEKSLSAGSPVMPQEKARDFEYIHKGSICFIVKPTNQCNGCCDYCSSGRMDAYSDMTEDMLEKMYDELFRYSSESELMSVSMLWHGGEPLLMGKTFFRKAWGKTSEAKFPKIRHLMQTNLLSLDPEWIEMFENHQVNVSTSVDPQGSARKCKDGNPQYPDWIKKFSLICKSNVKLGIVFTVTAKDVDRVEDLYCFFKNVQYLASREIGVKFNPVYELNGKHAQKVTKHGLQPSDYGLFLIRLWNLWDKEGRLFPISPFLEWETKGQLPCEFSGECQDHFLSIDGDGNIYHCGRFVDIGLTLGNIRQSALSTIITENQWRRQLYERNSVLLSGHCGSCDLWEYCRGGCPFLAYQYFADALTKSPLCGALKTFFGKNPQISNVDMR